MSANLVLDQLKIINTRNEISKLDKFAKACFIKFCEEFKEGRLILEDANEHYAFGDFKSELIATIKINSPSFYSYIFSHGENGLAEAYINGYWSCSDLSKVLQIGIKNNEAAKQMSSWKSKIVSMIFKLEHFKNRNSKEGSKKNILSHYDLGNSFFKEFLDPTMTYSCGVFETDKSTMEEASIHKIDLLCRKLDLKPEDHLLEIGTGWGAFAIHAAKNYGCHVTTTTISDSQFDYAKAKFEEVGLSHKITLLKQDYRELTGQFDKLVSVEMIEAVGHEYMNVFFKTCNNLLKPNGVMAIQAITIQDQNYHYARKNIDFIKRYIFPGSCIPCNEIMIHHLSKETDMVLRDAQDIGLDYAKTLNLWKQAFNLNAQKIKAIGLSDGFLRLWNYYFSYCEAGFLERHISATQMVFAKPNYKKSIGR